MIPVLEAALADQTESTFEVGIGSLRYGCHFRPSRGADVLFVMLRSSIDRQRETLPVFWRQNFGTPRWNRRFGKAPDGHLLCVTDPTLYFDDETVAGGFVGTHAQDAVKGLLEIVRSAAERLGIAANRVIFWGISGAGFGAAMAAVRQGDDGRAIAINPPLDLGRFWEQGRALTAFRHFRLEGSIAGLGEALPHRSSIAQSLRAIRAQGARPRLVIVQNTQDIVYHKRHYLPFCRTFHVAAEGGVDPTGTILTIPYSDEGGHTALPDDMVRREVAEGLAFLIPADPD